MLNFTRIPAPRVTLVDPQTGIVSNEWFRFFNNLYSIIYAAPGNVTPGTYGSATVVPQITVDAFGTITGLVDVTIALDASQIVSGTIASARISGAYTGITGVGTLTVGAWNATAITTPYGGTGLTSYTAGDTLYYASGSALSNLAIGASTYINTSSGTAPQWTDPTTITIGKATNIAGGAANRIAYQTAADTTDFIVAPTVSNTYLEWSGTAFQWTANPLGTVTSVSVVSANGLAGTVVTATTTPAITLSTTVTGLLKGNGTAISAASSGTDYAPATSGTSILYGNGAGGFSNVTIGTGVSFVGGTLSATGSGGTVTSVAALTLGTTGTDLSSTVANPTTTPVITLNVPTASSVNRGALSAADWTTFNSKVSSQWITSGSDIYYSTGSVLVNRTTTINSSEIAINTTSATGIQQGIVINNPFGFGVGVGAAASALTFTRMTGASYTPVASVQGWSRSESTSNGGELAFSTQQTVAGGLVERMRIFYTGGVSIGNTTDPGATNLSVTGTIAGASVASSGDVTGTNITGSTSIGTTYAKSISGVTVPGGTTSTATVTFNSNAFWRPASISVRVICTVAGTGASSGAAESVYYVRHKNANTTVNIATTNITTSAGCVLSIAYGTMTATVTATVAAGTALVWFVEASSYSGAPTIALA